MPNVSVNSYYRNGRLVRGYSRYQPSPRGSVGSVRSLGRYGTIATKDGLGRFTGRTGVSGSGDRTGLLQESNYGRIVGRTRAR